MRFLSRFTGCKPDPQGAFRRDAGLAGQQARKPESALRARAEAHIFNQTVTYNFIPPNINAAGPDPGGIDIFMLLSYN